MDDEVPAETELPAGAAMLRDTVGGAVPGAMPLMLKSSIKPDVAEPEANRTDDLDSCLQYTVNAVSGERAAPPKTEDGTDTEEVDASLAMVYVRIHTGGSLPPTAFVKTGENDPAQPGAAAAAAEEDGGTTAQHAEGGPVASIVDAEAAASGSQASQQTSCSEAAAVAATGSAAALEALARPAHWEEVYKDVLQQIHSCRVSDEQCSSLQDTQAAFMAGAVHSTQQEQQEVQAAQDHSRMLEKRASYMAAKALASACMEQACTSQPLTPRRPGPGTSAGSSQVSASEASASLVSRSVPAKAAGPATPSTAGQPSQGVHATSAVTPNATTAEGVQEDSSSGLRTPVVLPPDAADLPMQAVLDELDTLLAKSDELRSSVQLRSSRHVSGQHTSTHMSRRSSFSTLDKCFTTAAAAGANAGSSIQHSGRSTDWNEAACSSRRRSSSQPPAGDRGADTGCSRRRNSSALPSRVDGDMEDSFDRTVLDSTEARDEIRQHLQMIISTGSRQDKQNNSGHRDAATSVGGLTTPRSAQQPATASPLSNAAPDHFSSASMEPRVTGSAAGASSFSREASLNRSGSVVERSEAGMVRRSSSSRYGGTENGSSMDKLHALYARLMSDTASHRRSSASESVQQGASSNGERPARRTGSMATGMAVPAASPMRSSVPYPLALAGTKLTDPAGGRRCRSVSPQKKDHQRAHALSHSNLQQQQQQQQKERQQQQGCQLRHSLSLCSSCGSPMHRDVAGISSAALPGAGPPAAAVHSTGAAASTGAADLPAVAAGVAALGIRTVSDMLPSTHISISGLMSGGVVAASVAHWERQTSPTPGQQSPVPGSPPARAAASNRNTSPMQRGRSPQRGLSKSTGGADPSKLMLACGRGAFSASPVRSGRGSGGVSYNERFASKNDKAAHSASTSPARHADSTSPRRGLATAPAPGSAVIMSSEGVGVTQISFGQLLQETALQQAMGQLQQGALSPCSYTEHVQSLSSAPPAATAGLGSEGCAGSGLLQESSTMQVLKTVPEDGIVTGPASSEPAPRHTHSRSNSRHRLLLPAQFDSPPAPESGITAAAALHQLSHGSLQGDTPRALVHSQSLPTDRTVDSRRNSYTDRHMTVSSSMRSRTSTISSSSSSSSKVWRPGGNRTDPRDDYKKLQTYESARLRALQKQGLLSPGCSTRLLLPTGDLDGPGPGSASSESRRSTADNLAAPVSPGALSGYCSTPVPPSGVSLGSYAAALQRRKNSTAAAAGSVSPRLLRTSSSASPGVSAARAAASRPAGPRSVLEPAHTAISLAALSGDSPPALQRSASPRLRKVEKPCQQQQQPDVWESLTGQPCPKSLMPMMQRLQHQHAPAGAGHKASHSSSSSSVQPSPDRLLRSGAKTQPASRSYPSSGNSTTAQVEEAIRAAQAALREKQQQVSQVRQALHGKWAGGARARSHSPGARQQPMLEEEACAGVLTDTLPVVNNSVWGGGSCTSSYTGKVPQLAAVQQHGAENAAASVADSQAQAAAEAQPDAGLLVQVDGQAHTHSRPTSRQHGALATVSAPVRLSAQPSAQRAGPEASVQSLVESGPEAPAAAAAEPSTQHGDIGSAVATDIPVQSPAVRAVQAAGSPRTALKPAHARTGRSSPESPRILKAYKGPVSYHNRHRSHSPKRRLMSALEALLKVAPDADGPQQHARPSSAEPALSSQLSGGPAAPASRRSSQHSPGQLSKQVESIGGSAPSQTWQQGIGKGTAIGSHRRSSEGGRSVSANVAEPWSAPRQRTASGLTGEQLLELHRRTSAAEAAEAAAAAAEGDTQVGECAEHAVPLDVLVRAYTALNKKNKNSGERAAAVAMLLDRITEGSTYNSDGLSGNVTPRSRTPDPAQQPTDGSMAAEQWQQKLRSSPLQLDVLGRGLMPESPRGAGTGSPASPSAIIQTLKQDSLSSWHRVSPERQAAHASLLATPKHRHANSYAADLAALAAGRSSNNLHSKEKSVHRTDSPAGGAPGSAGKQQQPGSASPGPAEMPPYTANSAENTPVQHTREGSVTGAANRCTPLRGARLSSANGAAVDAAPVQEQEQGPLPAQPECLHPAAPVPRPMVATATGRLVLDSVGAQDMTVSAALAWLKSGLQNPDAAPPAPPAKASLQHKPQPCSPKRKVQHARPCSPFTCGIFGGAPRGMVRSSDDEAEAAAAAAAISTLQPQPQQQLQAGTNGVTFEMGSDDRLVMVVQQHGAVEPQRLQVTGLRLRHEEAGQMYQGRCSSSVSGGAARVGGCATCNSTLDLLTTGGSHTIELASESDWAGLLVGLNAMLLLLEQESPEDAEKLGSMPMSQVAWSMAVAGMDS